MSEKHNWEKRLSDNSLIILVAILVIAMASVVTVVGIYWYYFSSQSVLIDPEPWGQFGDFFGGTLNPIFGFLSVMALLAALVIQSRELKISSQELRNSALALAAQNNAIAHQSFEQTFFSWLDSYGDMLASVSSMELSGRNALKRHWHSQFRMETLAEIASEMHKEIDRNQFGHINTSKFREVVADSPEVLTEAAMTAWQRLYKENEYQLDSVFRNLYRLILWVDSQHQDRMTPAQKWFYVSIVRAQLSWIEMVYLFYNGYTQRGERLNRLIEKYSLFNNLNFDSDPVIAHIRQHGYANNWYAETAYDSSKARIKLGLPESSEETLAMAAV